MKQNRWFTLLEIMIVIAIIAVLIPIMTPEFSKYIARARDSSRITDLYHIKNALLVYEQDNDNFPLSFSAPEPSKKIYFTFDWLHFINETYAVGFWGGWWGGGAACPAIGIVCAPWFRGVQDPLTCAESCVPVSWTRTDDQCASYLNDAKFTQIIGNIPKDPQNKNPFPCLDTGDVGSYGYSTSTGSDGNTHFILTAELEMPPLANVGYNTLEAALAGGNIESLKELSKWSYTDSPGDIPYYVIYE